MSTGSEDDTLNVVISSQWELSLIRMLSSFEGADLTEDEEDEEEEELDDDDDEKDD